MLGWMSGGRETVVGGFRQGRLMGRLEGLRFAVWYKYGTQSFPDYR